MLFSASCYVKMRTFASFLGPFLNFGSFFPGHVPFDTFIFSLLHKKTKKKKIRYLKDTQEEVLSHKKKYYHTSSLQL